MHAKDVIRNTLGTSEVLINSYVGDLTDEELLVRPVEGMNHVAWQLGHLISAEHRFLETMKPGSAPPLPEGFDVHHDRPEAASDDKARFKTKAEYQALAKAQREATLKLLDSMGEDDLDKPGPERFQRMAPTIGAVFNLIGTHNLMHVGQFVAVRRTLKKPIVI